MNNTVKKICFTVENYYPKTSGVPVVVKYLAEGLSSTGLFEVHVATIIDSELLANENINGVYVHRFYLNYNIVKKPRGKDLARYIEFIRSTDFDVIILECTQCVTSDAVFQVLDHIKTKVILHSHGFSGLALKPFRIMSSIKHTVGNTLYYFVWKKYYNRFLPEKVNMLSNCICLSSVDNDYCYLKRYNDKVYVLPNAAENTFFEAHSNNNLYKYVNKCPQEYMICIAYYSDIKNQIGILEQYYKSSSSNNYAMIFIGTEKNAYYEKLNRLNKKFEKKYGKKDIYILTGVKRSDIAGILSGASLYLSGSIREAFSISLVEAMALGIPFVATNVGNASQLPGGCVIDNINEMHIKIDNLLEEETQDYFLYSSNGKKFALENCNINSVVIKLSEIIKDIAQYD